MLIFHRQPVLPGRHGGSGLAVRDRAQQFCIGFSGGGRRHEIAGAWREERGFGPVAVSRFSMAFHAMLAIDALAAIKHVRRLGHQQPAAAPDQHQDEKELVGAFRTRTCGCGMSKRADGYGRLSVWRPKCGRGRNRSHHVRSHRFGSF